MVHSSKYEVQCRPKCISKDTEKCDQLARNCNISVMELFKVLSTGANVYPQPWLPVIDYIIDDAFLQL